MVNVVLILLRIKPRITGIMTRYIWTTSNEILLDKSITKLIMATSINIINSVSMKATIIRWHLAAPVSFLRHPWGGPFEVQMFYLGPP